MVTEYVERYEIIKEIGQGGFALVYQARDTQLDRLVAVKELRPNLLSDAAWVQRFRQEAKVIARLDHPHIVPIYDVGGADDRLYLVMRLVEGYSLEKYLGEKRRLSWPEALSMMGGLAAGLDYAHDKNILHRDLKPGNILLDPERGPMLTDFGLAKLTSEGSMGMSASGTVVGTPHYIAPEVWEGQPASRASDIYALACILHEMVAGEKIFKGETPPAVMMAHFKPLQLPEQWPDEVPARLSEVLHRALATQPGDRYQTAGAMLADLETLPHNGTAPATSATPAPAAEPTPARLDTPDFSLRAPAGAGQPTPAPAAEATPQVVAPPAEDRDAAPHNTARAKKWGCISVSLIAAATLIIITLIVCNSFSDIVQQTAGVLSAGIEVGPPVTSNIYIPRLPGGEVPTVELVRGSGGALNIRPGNIDGLVTGTATYNIDQLRPQIITQSDRIHIEPYATLGPLEGLMRHEIINRWDLQLGTAPLELYIDSAASSGNVELGGLSLVSLEVLQGVAHFDLAFSEPNRTLMKDLEFTAGASQVSLVGLANTRAESILFDGGAGDYTLDFSGTLLDDMDVTLNMALSDVRLLVPEGMAAILEFDESSEVEVTTSGQWEQISDSTYRMPGDGPTLQIEADVSASRMQLRSIR